MCWQQANVPTEWRQGVIRLIPKAAAKNDPDLPSNFHPVALTSCVGSCLHLAGFPT